MTTLAKPAPAARAEGPNWALITTIFLPASAVVASFVSLACVLMNPDPEMPQEYHWEGDRLDADFARAERAATLGVHATLAIAAGEHLCRMSFTSTGAPPEALVLRIAHATLRSLDRTVVLRPALEGYEGRCDPPPSGHWRIELSDLAATWSVRTDATGTLESLALIASSPSRELGPEAGPAR